MFDLLFAGAIAATFANQPVTPPTVEPPDSGTYIGLSYVPSADGNGCVMGSGSQVIAEVSFGGLSGKTLFIRYPYSSSNGALVSVQTVTLTSGLGTLSPSGTFTWTGTGAYTWDVSGSYSATITEVGTHAFILNVTSTYTNCTETQSLSLARTGTDNN
jgi:hypothetical protein